MELSERQTKFPITSGIKEVFVA